MEQPFGNTQVIAFIIPFLMILFQVVTAVIAFLISFFDGLIPNGAARGDNPGLVLGAGLSVCLAVMPAWW